MRIMRIVRIMSIHFLYKLDTQDTHRHSYTNFNIYKQEYEFYIKISNVEFIFISKNI